MEKGTLTIKRQINLKSIKLRINTCICFALCVIMIAKQIFFCRNNILNANLFVRNLNSLVNFLNGSVQVGNSCFILNYQSGRKPGTLCRQQKDAEVRLLPQYRQKVCFEGTNFPGRRHSAGKEVR